MKATPATSHEAEWPGDHGEGLLAAQRSGIARRAGQDCGDMGQSPRRVPARQQLLGDVEDERDIVSAVGRDPIQAGQSGRKFVGHAP